MQIENSEAKRYHAILFFTSNVNDCGKEELFKLLYLLDFKHFRQIGRSVTGLEYYAWPEGPIPVELNKLIKADLSSVSSDQTASAPHNRFFRFIADISSKGSGRISVKTVKEFNGNTFTKRESQIMKELVQEYKNSGAEEMIEAAHLENSPWRETLEGSKEGQERISYERVLDSQDKENILEIINENRNFWKNYK
jgi:uncharacterized phage-associated protein